MASADGGSGAHPPEKKEEVAAGADSYDPEDPRFQCCVCLELLYKPVVIACGHMSCFWCVHKAMHSTRESHCAICRQPYSHFPSICQLLHHLLGKLEPDEYKRREKEVLEFEKRLDTYSPQIIEFLCSKDNVSENGKDGDSKTGPLRGVSIADNTISEDSKKVKLEDVSCVHCNELLYQPSVLNCGHVYCASCLPTLDGESLKCEVCGGLHPVDYPKICLDLDHFLEEYFPAEYESRREKHQLVNTQRSLEESSSGTSCTKVSMNKPSTREKSVHQDENLLNVHIGVGCDSCGVYPIRGKRYKCKECTELIGFDLCEECYNTKSKLPGRFNQQHTPDHRMELDDTTLYQRFLRFLPADGREELLVEEAFVAPGGVVVQLIGDDHEMEEGDVEEDQML